jgi:low affinity Fe/Cu permease
VRASYTVEYIAAKVVFLWGVGIILFDCDRRIEMDHKLEQRIRIEQLKKEIAVGLEEARRGEGRKLELEEFKTRARLEFKRRTNQPR